MSLIMSALWAVLKMYLTNIATKEVIDWVIFEAAEAGVKSTKTDYDDKLLVKVKAAVHGDKIPE